MNKKYFSLEKSKQTATINIYGDITSWAWEELGEMSAVNLSKQLEAMGDVTQIDVYINSYGGEVAEGLAIYNALKRHKAKVTTYCDGFACSIASVIFMAGDERVMNEASLLMIHNAWTWAQGDSKALRKQADDLEKITQASVEAYKAHSNLKEEEIKELMDAETWILPEEALSYGFATSVLAEKTNNASQNARKKLFSIVMAAQDDAENTDEDEDESVNDEDENIDTDDSNGSDDEETENAEEETNEETEDESENVEDESEEEEENSEESEEDEGETEKAKAAQKWSGFFNAIFNN